MSASDIGLSVAPPTRSGTYTVTHASGERRSGVIVRAQGDALFSNLESYWDRVDLLVLAGWIKWKNQTEGAT